MKELLRMLVLLILMLPANFHGQSIDKEAIKGARFICDCSKNALFKNGVDIVKLEEIFDSYQLDGSLLVKYRSDVRRINNQLNSAYSALEIDIYKCRGEFRIKFQNNLGNSAFLAKMQGIISKNAFTSGPQLMQTLSQ